ncbi:MULTISPECIES: hypothetical protein [Bradyrhizobium]|uniref:Uncharacterized protein n=1 Tax=Bradyrhizobium yuanmingense TaxID=108015 RepID=A0A1C3UD82_9BRAD|nr:MULTISPECIES: hypothetical protein [Bradyrhizobium]MCA1379837.1 hypothetical protein [Bradyrhizobium sp. BRP05]MCA1420149.1 hypothetical protein [Bradyrhizobium sp. BRP23]TWI20829.1 hypothetical protein IQ15_06171 [Bradyrhizobium yuanmingense]SCB13408.1 hypothetical protein GA0061099_1001974 [Bradyrhizobium yuanmingense]
MTLYEFRDAGVNPVEGRDAYLLATALRRFIATELAKPTRYRADRDVRAARIILAALYSDDDEPFEQVSRSK